MILGKENASTIQNLLLMLLKSYIYQHRMKKRIPGFTGFISYLKFYQKIENMYIVTKTKYILFKQGGQTCYLTNNINIRKDINSFPF